MEDIVDEHDFAAMEAAKRRMRAENKRAEIKMWAAERGVEVREQRILAGIAAEEAKQINEKEAILEAEQEQARIKKEAEDAVKADLAKKKHLEDEKAARADRLENAIKRGLWIGRAPTDAKLRV